MTRIGRLFDSLKRDEPQGLHRLPHGGRSLAGPHARAGGSAGARRRRPDRTGRAVLRPDRRWPGDPARRRACAQGRHHAGKRARDRARRSARRPKFRCCCSPISTRCCATGWSAWRADAAAAGIDGCLLTDACVEEADEYVGAMHRHGLDTVFLAAPTSTERRLKLVAQYSTGFVYLVSRTGVTGERESLSAPVAPLVQAVRAVTDLPLAVGLRHLEARARGGTGQPGGSRGGGQRVRAPDRAERGQCRRSRFSSNLSRAN